MNADTNANAGTLNFADRMRVARENKRLRDEAVIAAAVVYEADSREARMLTGGLKVAAGARIDPNAAAAYMHAIDRKGRRNGKRRPHA